MSLGANLPSGQIQKVIDQSSMCNVPVFKGSACSQCDTKAIDSSGNTVVPIATTQSMLLASKTCPPPTPAEFAKYPKVAVPSSVRTQSLMDCVKSTNLNNRFAYLGIRPAVVPCPPLPPTMAGISQPSTRACNL